MSSTTPPASVQNRSAWPQYSVWQAGATAARQGKPASDNPHNPIRYEFVCWNNGWAFAYHMKCKEDDEL